MTYTPIGIAFTAGGMLVIGSGLRLAIGDRHTAADDIDLGDDAMWLR